MELRGDMTGRDLHVLGSKVRVRVADADKMLNNRGFCFLADRKTEGSAKWQKKQE